MIKAITILLLLTIQVKAYSNFGINKLYYFNIKTNGTSSVEKLFTNDVAILKQPDKSIIQNFEGWLQVNELSQTNRSTLYAATISIANYKLLNEFNEQLQLPFALQQLETTFYFEQLHNNIISRFYFTKEITAGAQKIVKEMLVHFQYAFHWSNKLKWTANETSTYGTCTMQYKLIAKNDAITTIQKTALKIENNNIAATKKNTVTTNYTPKGNLLYSYNAVTKKLQYVKGHYNIITTVGTKKAGSLLQKIYITDTVNNFIKATLSSTQLELFNKIKDSLTVSFTNTLVTSQQFLSNVRKATLGDDTFETLIVKLHNEKNNYDSLYLKLRALCTIYPTSSYLLMPILDTANAESKIYSSIWSAALGAENDEGVNALSSILLQHTNDWHWLKYIIGNMGLAKNCTDSMTMVFQQLYNTTEVEAVKNTIELALGSTVDNLFNTDKAKSKTLYDWLLSKLQAKEKNTKNIIQEILVLGNTNTKNSYILLQPYTKWPDKEVSKLAKQTMAIIKTTIHN